MCMIPGRKLINLLMLCLPGSIYLSSGQAGCCSYSTGVRVTLLLAFKLYASSSLVLPGPGLPVSCCSSAREFDLVEPGLFQRLTLWVGIGWSARFSSFLCTQAIV